MHQKIKCFYLLVFILAPYSADATHACPQWIAKIVSLEGKVDSQFSGDMLWHTINSKETFCRGDKIRTAQHSRATLLFKNESRATLNQNTTLTFLAQEKESTTWYINLFEGGAFFRSRQPQRLNIHTPFINAVHEGTEFLVTVDSQQTEISVFDGQVAATNQLGKILIKKGYTGIAQKDLPPSIQALKIRPEDAVQWTLYYPPIVDVQTLELAKQNNLQSAINAYQQGDIFQALTLLNKITVKQQNSRYLTLKASLLLTVGRVDEALPLIDKALFLEPDNSHAFALQAIIAVAKNRQDSALNMAQKAVTVNPKSAVAQVALSYAYQANFNIESALKATQQAVHLSPDNALAWARLAELQLSTGERSAALESAQKAQALNPGLGHTQTILGFTYLSQVDIDEAKTAFTKAINLNSADPLARLGLGLAKIRQGDIEEGTSDIETAVSLDPENAIMRSYLGKAYYELRNDGYAETELTIAKEMDPNDPTPWFYDAIRKQTTNRPVEALYDMQKAIELNDNRGVYRSKLLLDEDLAARSASLGRIYNDLGFQRLGLIEGWKSVNTNPSNYSAHRLLADNYASQPRHEIARVSELLQSQLLQPINITPIQPQLAQIDIDGLGLGPSSPSFNEYNPLFTRNRFSLQASGIFGSNNTWGEDVVHSGLWDNWSYSLGQFHFETDGFRENNFLKQNTYNAFVQGNITDSLNLQAEYRHEERKNGDLSVNFDPNLFSSDFKENRNIDIYKLGGHYSYSSNSSFLVFFKYRKADTLQKDTIPVVLVQNDINLNIRGVNSEVQYQFNNSRFSLVTGLGYIHQTVTRIDTLKIPGLPSFIPQPDPVLSNPDITRIKLYNYSNYDVTDKVTITLGLSYDNLKIKNEFERHPINPKFGIIWKPFSSTTFRAAAFQILLMTQTELETTEPTQVAGFNQLINLPDGTIAWRFGGGLDHKISRSISIGAEYSERKLDVPFGTSSPLNWKESLGKAYLYLTPHDQVSLSIEYFYEKYDRQLYNTTQGIDNFKTENQWIPLTLNLFHPSGFSFMLKTTYANQSGIFHNGSTLTHGTSDFYIVDLGLNFRLPSRYGKISFGVKNLFDSRIQFQDINSTQSNSNENFFTPERVLFTRINLAF